MPYVPPPVDTTAPGPIGSGTPSTGAFTTLTATSFGATGPATVTSASASALAVGLNGATNPAFSVDASTGSQAAGLNVLGGTTTGAVALRILSSGTNNSLTIDAKGNGTLTLNGTATGGITASRLLTASAGVTIASGQVLTLGNAAVTGLVAGALAALTTASIVIYDSAGQAYRIPCVI